MSYKAQKAPVELGLRMLKSWSMTVTLSFMTQAEQIQTQQICVWFYTYGTSRAQMRFRLRFYYFIKSKGGDLDAELISLTPSGKVVELMTCDDTIITHKDWIAVQVKP